MNLFHLILSDERALAWSDGAHFLAAQSNERTPLWLYLAPSLPEEAVRQAAQCVASRLCLTPELQLVAEPERVAPVLGCLERTHALRLEAGMPMIAYACRRVYMPPCRGEMVAPEAAHQAAMASLLTQLVEDGEGQSLPAQEAARFAQAMVGSDALRLWVDGQVCAMAMVTHRAPAVARINTVVTERTLRGRGYAGMLVAQMCEELLAEGVTPMLYADARNPSSNRAYRKIGFEPVGTVTEYRSAG